ncbi:MAG: hypothetical protein JXB49_24990 [Bacteroidales bacterium]|nr:hypothetical protein [Bacteroidales bacterium]
MVFCLSYKLFRKISLVISLCIFLTLQLYAQSNYREGCVVDNQGDTLKGYIDDREWVKNPEKIAFKPSLESKDEVVCDVSNSTYFRIKGEDAYQRFTLPVSMDRIELPNLSRGPDTSKIIKTVFLKFLVAGSDVNLYSYSDNLKTRYFYWEKSANVPVELGYKVYYRAAENDFSKVMTLKSYLNQLTYLANKYGYDSKELKTEIEGAQYLVKDIARIVVKLNNGEAANFYLLRSKREKSIFKPIVIKPFATIFLRRSVLTKLQGSTYNIHGSTLTYPEINTGSDRNVCWLPSVGMGFQIMRKTGARFYAQEELAFSMDKLSASDEYLANGITGNYSYDLSEWNLTLNNLAIYNVYHKQRLKIFIGTGIEINYSRIMSLEYNIHKVYPSDPIYERDENRKDFMNPNQFWLSVPLKAGFIINNTVSAHAIYRFPTARFNMKEDELIINTMEIGVSYLF